MYTAAELGVGICLTLLGACLLAFSMVVQRYGASVVTYTPCTRPEPSACNTRHTHASCGRHILKSILPELTERTLHLHICAALAHPLDRIPFCGTTLRRSAIWACGLGLYCVANVLKVVALMYGPMTVRVHMPFT